MGAPYAKVEYAPYIQSAHQELIQLAATIINNGILPQAGDGYPGGNLSITPGWVFNSPAASYVPQLSDLDPVVGFIGTGYLLSDFPSAWDMFGKFVAVLDLEALYEQIAEEMILNEAIVGAVEAKNQYLNDNVNQGALPRLRCELRDIGAVRTSSFFDAQTKIWNQKQQEISNYSASVKGAAIALAHNRWAKHLDWNSGVIDQYINTIRLFLSVQQDWSAVATEIKYGNVMWNSTVLRQMGDIIATLNGAAAASSKKEPGVASWIGAALNAAETGSILYKDYKQYEANKQSQIASTRMTTQLPMEFNPAHQWNFGGK